MRLRGQPAGKQLGKLASAGRTGVLHLPEGGGTVHLLEGNVTYAECNVTPGLASRLSNWPDSPGHEGPSAFERDWVIRDATVDAALELLPGRPCRGRFREGEVPVSGGAGSIPVGELLAEVARRRKIMRQMSVLLTADTTVARNPRLRERGVPVSAAQGALLVRLSEPSTPRRLAMDTARSVFATTIEVFRLIALNLVSPADGAAPDEQAGDIPGHRKAAISFLRAVAG